MSAAPHQATAHFQKYIGDTVRVHFDGIADSRGLLKDPRAIRSDFTLTPHLPDILCL